MSNEPKNSLLGSLWHGALVLLGIAVAVTIAVDLLLQVWEWLALGAAIVIGVLWLIWYLRSNDSW